MPKVYRQPLWEFSPDFGARQKCDDPKLVRVKPRYPIVIVDLFEEVCTETDKVRVPPTRVKRPVARVTGRSRKAELLIAERKARAGQNRKERKARQPETRKIPRYHLRARPGKKIPIRCTYSGRRPTEDAALRRIKG